MSASLRALAPRLLLGAALVYFVAIGATYNGILDVDQRLRSLDVLLALTLIWLGARAALRWRWQATPLGLAFAAWALVFALSLAANPEQARRSAMALWYMGAYLLLLLALFDACANRGLSRGALVDALLFAGLILMLFGGVQVLSALRAGQGLPRPVSVLGNANTFAAALVLLAPLALARLWAQRTRALRLLWAGYLLAALALLLATFSRGGWLGAAGGMALSALWLLADRGWLRRARLAAAWAELRLPARAGVIGAALAGVLALLAAAQFLIGTFAIGGRGLDFRAFIYETAIEMFRERPLLGHGLFTFGGGLARLNPTPPTEPHSHAHNLPLQVAAEMGLAGLAALALSAGVIVRVGRFNAQQVRSPSERAALIGAGGAVAAAGLHHLFDLPTMNPALMLLTLLALAALTCAPPGRGTPARWPAVRWLAVLALAAAVLLAGRWGERQYRAYWLALSSGTAQGERISAAQALQPVIDADPSYALYHQQQGLLLATAAAEGDRTALPAAIAAFERYTALAPEYAMGWASLAALRAQASDTAGAADALLQVQRRAPVLVQNWRALGIAYAPWDPAQPFAEEDRLQPNIAYIQWLHLALPRTSAPQTSQPLPEAVWEVFDAASPPALS